MKQRGVVLFISLVALVVISLAAVALIRSIDTSTLIAGNLAFKQAATTSGDAGTEAAVTWLQTTYNNNLAKDVLHDSTHPLNATNGATGYYSNADDVGLNLFADTTWADGSSVLVLPDPNASGNRIRYIIQRMCLTANVQMVSASCLYSAASLYNSGMAIPLPQEICNTSGCPAAGQSPMYRITVRVAGPRNTISYIQSFVF